MNKSLLAMQGFSGNPEHLEALATPALCLQGTRDPFGTREEVEGYTLAESFEVVWLEDGDHSLKPRKRSGRTLEQNLEEAVDAIDAFLTRLDLTSG